MQQYPFLNPELPLAARVYDLISRMTLEEKISLMSTKQAAVERLGINEYWVGGEAAHGIAWIGEATVFPQTIGLACTWNKKLMHDIGKVIGIEARGYQKKIKDPHGLTLWAPTVDMERDPRWGRTEEAYGEDPCLTGELSSCLIKGMQGDHPFYLRMGATLKHFYANNNEKDRGRCSTSIDPRNMHEYYLKAFKIPILKGRVCCVMTAYNSVNGTPCIIHPHINKFVKKEWDLPGFIVSDAADFQMVATTDKYFSSHTETAAAAIKAGLDCICDEAAIVTDAITQAVKEGSLPESGLDAALYNIFKIRFRLGQFDPDDRNPYSEIPASVIGAPEHIALAGKAARESIVLLKNKRDTLPLKQNEIKSIAIIGPLADAVHTDWYSGTLPYRITPLESIKHRLPGAAISFVEGCDRIRLRSPATGGYLAVNPDKDNEVSAGYPYKDAEIFELTDWGWGRNTIKSKTGKKYITGEEGRVAATSDELRGWYLTQVFQLPAGDEGYCELKTWDDKYVTISPDDTSSLKIIPGAGTELGKFKKEIVSGGIPEAAEAAKNADVAVVFAGNTPYINGKEDLDRPDIKLPPAQEKLLQAVYEANPNTILVVISPYPEAINWAEENIPAILYTSHGGQEMSKAVSDVLLGDYNPGGRLNMTWYKSVKDLPDIFDYDIIKGKRTYMYFDGSPLYPFGYGLSYSKFNYSNFQLSPKKVSAGDTLEISVEVANTGTMTGDEVVQLYVKAENSRVPRPRKELKDFDRISLEPGKTKKVTFRLPVKDLSLWDVTRERYCVEPGRCIVMVGKSSEDIQLQERITILGEKIPPRDLFLKTWAKNYDDYHDVYLTECRDGGECACRTREGAWITFRDVDVKEGISGFEARYSAGSSDGNIEIRMNGPSGQLLNACPVSGTGGEQNWATTDCSLNIPPGRHDVYLHFSSNINLSWIRFK